MVAPLLQVSDLHAGYGRAEVLTGLNLQLSQGQVVTVIGPNGAGKSTTLNALMGVLPSRGRVVFDGQDLRRPVARGARDAGHGAGARERASCSAPCRSRTTWCSAAIAR